MSWSGFAAFSGRIGEGVINNLEPTPNSVRYRWRMETIPKGAQSESAALYCRVTPSVAGEPCNGIYIETDSPDSEQSTGIKIIHKGLNDAAYIGIFSAAAALETASFKNGSTGFISTMQWDGASSDFGNSTAFQAVFGWDGTGGSTTPANYGIFYAARSLGNSFRTRLQDPAATGWAWGRVEWAISSWDLGRNHFDVYNHGQLNVRSRVSTVGAPTNNDAHLRTVSSYWSGAASVDKAAKIYVDATGGACAMVFKQGTEGAEAETYRCDASGNPTYQGSTFRVVTDRTIINAADPGNKGDICWDSGFLYVCVAASSWKKVAIAAW